MPWDAAQRGIKCVPIMLCMHLCVCKTRLSKVWAEIFRNLSLKFRAGDPQIFKELSRNFSETLIKKRLPHSYMGHSTVRAYVCMYENQCVCV